MPSQSKNAPMRPFAERAAVILLCIAVVASPLVLGTTAPWARLALECFAAVATVLWAASAPRPVRLLVIPLLVLPVPAIQLMPMPENVLVSIAPISAGAWRQALGADHSGWAPTSVNPHDTFLAGWRAFLMIAACVSVASLTRYGPYRNWLTSCLAASSALILITGLVFGSARDNRTLMGFIDLKGPLHPNFDIRLMNVETVGVGTRQVFTANATRFQLNAGHTGDGFGCYLYSNHFAGAMILTVPCLLSLALSHAPRFSAKWARILLFTGCFIVWSLAVFAVGFQARSRAGTAALIIGSLILLTLLSQVTLLRRFLYVVVTAAVVSLIFAAAALLGSSQDVASILPAVLRQPFMTVMGDARTLAAKAAIRMFLASPYLGTGLDTYKDMFPRFSSGGFTLFYAHNDFAQMLAEGGIACAILAFSLVKTLASRFMEFCTESKGEARTMNAGFWAGLIGISLHSLFDWNLHVPANAFLTAIVAGLAASSASAAAKRSLWARLPIKGLTAGLLIGAAVAIVLLTRDTFSQYAIKQLRNTIVAGESARDPNVPDSSAENATAGLDFAKRMAYWDSRNANLLIAIGQAHLYRDLAGSSDDAEFDAQRYFSKAQKATAAPQGIPESPPASKK